MSDSPIANTLQVDILSDLLNWAEAAVIKKNPAHFPKRFAREMLIVVPAVNPMASAL